jgi:dihydropteroate synthase
MGILNLTPDSFSDGGHYTDPRAALAQARRLVEGGCGLLDLGAESTRPGAEPVAPGEEMARLGPALDLVRGQWPALPLSLDTRHASVARWGLERGIGILNDVCGFRDPDMARAATESGCTVIAMRSRMTGGHFHMPPYGGPGRTDALEILREMRELRDRLLALPLDPGRIILDPGFGFGTTFGEEQALWEALPDLPGLLDWPVERFCIALSRKRFVAWRAGTPDLAPEARDGLTAEAHEQAMDMGYRLFRTHRPPLVTHETMNFPMTRHE